MLWRLFVVALLAPALAFRASPHAANRLAHRAPALSMVIDLSEVAGADETSEQEMLLTELCFSQEAPQVLIARNPLAFDDAFCTYVTDKANDTSDIEERMALKSLVGIIGDVKKAIAEAEAADAAVVDAEVVAASPPPAADVAPAADAGPRESVDVFQEMRRMQGTMSGVELKPIGEEEAEAAEAGLTKSQLRTYEALLARIAGGAEGEGATSLEASVEAYHDMCDLQFVNLLEYRRGAGGDDAQLCADVGKAINAITERRLNAAATRLQAVMRAGAVPKMLTKLSDLVLRGEIDAPFLELLQVNLQQAQAAGPAGAPAAEVMKTLLSRVKDLLDEQVEPEKKLMRALLRTEDKEARATIFKNAFRPKSAIALGDVTDAEIEETDTECEVTPPAFIAACKALILNFGNIEADGFADRLRSLIDEAEVVATELYGKSLTPKEQQQKAWDEGTVSVFDLEAHEKLAEMDGETMPWHNDKFDAMLPDGFTKEGIKKIGGN